MALVCQAIVREARRLAGAFGVEDLVGVMVRFSPPVPPDGLVDQLDGGELSLSERLRDLRERSVENVGQLNPRTPWGL